MRIRAFTFIEILIAMAIISIVSALGATSYRDYTDLSALNTASDEVVGVLNLAKSRAQTQVKPDNCAGSQLSGYRVSFCSQSGDCVDGHQVYRLDAVCGSSDVQVGNSYTLPGSVVFDDQNPNNVFFGVLDGSATSTNPIRLVLKDKVKEITINNQSLIAVSELNTLGPTAAPTEPVDEEIDEPPVVTVQTGFDQDTKTVSGPAGTTQFRMYWTVSGNYYSCTGDDLLSGNLEAPFGYRDITVNQTGKYTVTCAGSGGISSDSISVTCEDCPGITTFNVTPQNPINYFTPVNVSWQASSGADHCSRSGIGNIGIWQNPNVPTSGSFVSTNLTSNVTYELTCYSGPDESTSGRVSKSYLVEVKPDEILPTSGPTYVPTVTLTPSPTLGPSAVVTPTKTPTPSPTKTPTPSPTSGPPSSTPYGGTPRTIPGTLQAEDFDTGGEGLAYHDTTSGNSGDSTYRNYNVDLYDRDGGVIVGSIADGEWLLFTTNITGGTYDINFRTAASTEGRSMRILINGQLLKTIDIPSTGSTGNYQSFTIPRVSISGGNNKLVKLEFVGGNFSFNWISFTTSLSTPIFLKNVNPGGNGITLRDGPAGTSIGRSFDLGHVGRQLSGPVRAILPSNNTSYDWYQIDSSYDPVGWAANSLTQTWLAPETFPKTLTFFSGISGSPPLYYTSGCDYETQGDTCRRDTLVIARQDIYLNKIACNNCGAKEWVVYESNSSFSNSKLLATGTTLTTSGNWKEATLTTPLKLSKGTYYIIGFSIDVGNSTFRNFDGYNGDTFPDFNYVDPLKLRVGTSGSGYADLGAFDIRVTVDNE